MATNHPLYPLQFWSAYMPCGEPQREDATRTFMDQMDVIKRFIKNYTLTFMYATTADDIDEAFKANKVQMYCTCIMSRTCEVVGSTPT